MKFEPLEPSHSGYLYNFKGSCEAAILLGQKYDLHPQNTRTCYIYIF